MDTGITSSEASCIYQERTISLNLLNAALPSTEHGSDSASAIDNGELIHLNTNSKIPTTTKNYDKPIAPVEFPTNISHSNITKLKDGTDKGLKSDINYMDQTCDQDGVKIEVNISLGQKSKNVIAIGLTN